MGIIAPNQKKLLIPRKGSKVPNAPVSQSDHDANMRAIEIWANAQAPGGVTQLIAGTNITLDPTDGTGIVTVNATGGGGGATPGYGYMVATMDLNDYPFVMFVGPTNPGRLGVVQLGPLWGSFEASTPAAAEDYTFASSWFTDVNAGDSVNILPEFTMPPFTSPGAVPIGADFLFQAWDLNPTFANYAQYRGTVSIASGATVQTTVGDLSAIEPASGDLTLVAGTGFSGNGLVSTSGAIAYLASVTGRITVPTGTTFP